MKLMLLLSIFFISCSYNKIRIKTELKNVRNNFTDIRTDISDSIEIEKLFSYYQTINNNSLIIDDLFVYSTKRGKMIFYDMVKHKDIGSYRMSYGTNVSPVANEGYIVNLTGKGSDNVYIYNIEKGYVTWKEKVGLGFESRPVLDDETLFAAGTNGMLYRINMKDFKIEKQVKLKSSVRVNLLSNENSIFILDEKQNIYSLKKNDFKTNWKLKLDKGSVFVQPELSGEYLYYFLNTGFVYKINHQTGKINWAKKVGEGIYTNGSISGNDLFIGNTDGNVYRLDTEGNIKQKYYCGSIIGTKVIVGPEKIYFGTGKGEFFIYNKRTGKKLWKTSFKGRFKSSPVIWKNKILVYTDYDHTYLIKNKKSED